MNAVWERLHEDYGVIRPPIKTRIKNGESAEVGDFDQKRQAFPVWVHVIGAAYPEKYWYDAASTATPAMDLAPLGSDLSLHG
jgi:hypothetical protein